MGSNKKLDARKKLLILLSVIAASLITLAIIGMIVYDKASSYVISKTIVEFGQLYEDLSPEDKQKIDDFINSIELPESTEETVQNGSGGSNSNVVAQNNSKTATTEKATTEKATTEKAGAAAKVETGSDAAPASGGQSSGMLLTAPDGSRRSVSDIEKIVTKEDKNKITSLILSKMTMDEALNAFMSFGGKMSGEKFEAFKEEMKSKFTAEEIYVMKEMYVKYMNAE